MLHHDFPYLQQPYILYIKFHVPSELHTDEMTSLPKYSPVFRPLRISPRPISTRQLNALPHLHSVPINLVVFKGSYFRRMGYLILRGASRLDAFSVYPVPAWLPGYALGNTTGTPEVSPPRSSRTKGSSSQISCARAG